MLADRKKGDVAPRAVWAAKAMLLSPIAIAIRSFGIVIYIPRSHHPAKPLPFLPFLLLPIAPVRACVGQRIRIGHVVPRKGERWGGGWDGGKCCTIYIYMCGQRSSGASDVAGGPQNCRAAGSSCVAVGEQRPLLPAPPIVRRASVSSEPPPLRPRPPDPLVALRPPHCSPSRGGGWGYKRRRVFRRGADVGAVADEEGSDGGEAALS